MGLHQYAHCWAHLALPLDLTESHGTDWGLKVGPVSGLDKFKITEIANSILQF